MRSHAKYAKYANKGQKCFPQNDAKLLQKGSCLAFFRLTVKFWQTCASLKGQCNEIFSADFLHQIASPGPITHTLERFRFFQIFMELFKYEIVSAGYDTQHSGLKGVQLGNFYIHIYQAICQKCICVRFFEELFL